MYAFAPKKYLCLVYGPFYLAIGFTFYDLVNRIGGQTRAKWMDIIDYLFNDNETIYLKIYPDKKNLVPVFRLITQYYKIVND